VKKYFSPLLALVISLSCATSSGDTPSNPSDKTENSILRAKATKEIIDALETKHFNAHVVDDEASSKLLDAYLNALDPAHLFLMQSDIRELAKYRQGLDNELHDGSSAASVVIFRRYQQRASARLQKIIDAMPAAVKAMRFDGEDYADLDRGVKSPWLADAGDGDALWRAQLKNAVLNLHLAGKSQEEIVDLLRQRYRTQLQRIEQASDDEIFSLYMNALLSVYDSHSNYFPLSPARDFNISATLKSVGIGLVLKSDGDYIKVTRAVPGGPAAKQGDLRPGDRIVAVGEGNSGEMRDVVGWRVDDVVNLLRGPRNSIVRLDVLPADSALQDQRKTIALARSDVPLEQQTAYKQIIEVDQNGGKSRVAVITIPSLYVDFEAMRRGDKDYRSVVLDVRNLLSESLAADVQGVVLDLRDNGGGALQQANALCGLFINSGPTVQLRNSDRKAQIQGKPRSSVYYDGPVVLLINRLSASGTEILAGALQDYQRALIVGDSSFGAGTIQQLLPLSYGELKLTEGEAFRISGQSIERRGVIPDIAFPSLYDATQVGESNLDNVPLADPIATVSHKTYFDIPGALQDLQAKHLQRADSDSDFQLLKAMQARREQPLHRLSLNEAVRKRQREENNAQLLAEKKISTAGDKSDPFLMEAVRILIDAKPVFELPRAVHD